MIKYNKIGFFRKTGCGNNLRYRPNMSENLTKTVSFKQVVLSFKLKV